MGVPYRCLVVVGSITFADRFAWRKAERIMIGELNDYAPELCASGGAQGIDTLFRQTARMFGFDSVVQLRPNKWHTYVPEDKDFIEFLPREDILNFAPGKPRWEAPGGYRDRNVMVATAAQRLVAIRCHQSSTFGSGWTLQFADQQLGRDTRMVIL
jgi:hypothetical protein